MATEPDLNNASDTVRYQKQIQLVTVEFDSPSFKDPSQTLEGMGLTGVSFKTMCCTATVINRSAGAGKTLINRLLFHVYDVCGLFQMVGRPWFAIGVWRIEAQGCNCEMPFEESSVRLT